MSNGKYDLIKYRLSRAFETFEDAKILANEKRWNSAINRLYYAAYYAVSALLLNKGLQPTTHTGVKSNFSEHFIKTGIISKELGKSILNFSHGVIKAIMQTYLILTEKKLTPILNRYLNSFTKLNSF